MRVLFDTNVLVDAAVDGRPYQREALFLLSEVEDGELSGVMAPLSLGTLWYLGVEVYDTNPRPLIRDLSTLLDLAPMGRSVLDRALQYAGDTDFEDMYIAEAGRTGGADGIVTRNAQDFAPTNLTAYHPTELVRVLS